MAELFGKGRTTVTVHIQNVFSISRLFPRFSPPLRRVEWCVGIPDIPLYFCGLSREITWRKSAPMWPPTWSSASACRGLRKPHLSLDFFLSQTPSGAALLGSDLFFRLLLPARFFGAKRFHSQKVESRSKTQHFISICC